MSASACTRTMPDLTFCHKEIGIGHLKSKCTPSVTLSQTLNLADISAISSRHINHHKCCQLIVRLSQVYRTERPPMFTTR